MLGANQCELKQFAWANSTVSMDAGNGRTSQTQKHILHQPKQLPVSPCYLPEPNDNCLFFNLSFTLFTDGNFAFHALDATPWKNDSCFEIVVLEYQAKGMMMNMMSTFIIAAKGGSVRNRRNRAM